MVSYGHRLVSTWHGGKASFRWGGAKLYRQYFDDYQAFVRRPDAMKEMHLQGIGDWVVIHVDLAQFYNLIDRQVLLEKLRLLVERSGRASTAASASFFDILKEMYSWHWHREDLDELALHESLLPDVGLPQGLAASGFFANAYLIDFDTALIRKFGKPLTKQGWLLIDYCRYVDDMRFVVSLGSVDFDTFKADFLSFLRRTLSAKAPGMCLNEQKTNFVQSEAASRQTPVADAMKAVDRGVSGPLDMDTGRHALAVLDGLIATAAERGRHPDPVGTGVDESLRRIVAVEPDVRSETLERFVAHRWRRIFRALRPMAEDDVADSSLNIGRRLLDQRAKEFSLELLRKWIFDPANVRLLRVALDLYPSADHVSVILGLLRVYLDDATSVKRLRKAAEYVGAELLRAAATETGMVADRDALPSGSDVAAYRAVLVNFAEQCLNRDSDAPWYLAQQALLLLAVMGKSPASAVTYDAQNSRYAVLHTILKDGSLRNSVTFSVSDDEFVALCIVAHQLATRSEEPAAALADWLRNAEADSIRAQFPKLADDPDLLRSAISRLSKQEQRFWNAFANSTGYVVSQPRAASLINGREYRLTEVIASLDNPFTQETAALQLLLSLVREWGSRPNRARVGNGSLTPSRIMIRSANWRSIARLGAEIVSPSFQIRLTPGADFIDERFVVPSWCPPADRWKHEIGQVLRGAILGNADYSATYATQKARGNLDRYIGVRTSWFKRRHGLLNDRVGLGNSLLPVSPWIAELLNRLLHWPGMSPKTDLVSLRADFSAAQLRQVVERRIEELGGKFCRLSDMPLYPVRVIATNGSRSSGLRVAIVQTAMPLKSDLMADVLLNAPQYRRKHRRHLTGMLRLLMGTMDVRAGYKDSPQKLDLVILPELAVHEADIPLLVRFADAMKCMVFCGLVFHPCADPPHRLINSGLWILPVQSEDGRSIRRIEQGKWHLIPEEQQAGISPYRPCQWLIEYSSRADTPPWRLTGAICYDATDLRLAADLRDRTDAFVVPALNQDTGTFDTMVSALHYHMYQHVLVANSAEFGGSTAQAPYKEPFRKTIVHHHGADQIAISILEVDFDRFLLAPTAATPLTKHPPAGIVR